MSWQKMRIPGAGAGVDLPGDRGRYLLWLERPHVQGEGHYIHFSWKEDSFCMRDYIQQVVRRQDAGTKALDIWKAASSRIPAQGELYVPVENFEFWTVKLIELTEGRQQGKTPQNLWSRLSSKFTSTVKKEDYPSVAAVHANEIGSNKNTTNINGGSTDVYHRFISLWRASSGFVVIERTVGCSARFGNEPLLWVFPTKFQIAPEGKGNAHYQTMRVLLDRKSVV